jgi:hypothetical protein
MRLCLKQEQAAFFADHDLVDVPIWGCHIMDDKIIFAQIFKDGTDRFLPFGAADCERRKAAVPVAKRRGLQLPKRVDLCYSLLLKVIQ